MACTNPLQKQCWLSAAFNQMTEMFDSTYTLLIASFSPPIKDA